MLNDHLIILNFRLDYLLLDGSELTRDILWKMFQDLELNLDTGSNIFSNIVKMFKTSPWSWVKT